MKKKNTSVLKAMVKLYEELCMGDFIIEDIQWNVLSENIGRSGRLVLWYNDNNSESAIYVDTLEFLTDEEIEKEFC